jgi:hypothetical protein
MKVVRRCKQLDQRPSCLHRIACPVVSKWCQAGSLLAELPRFFLSWQGN